MVQILPKEHDWSEVGQLFGQGATQGYQNRADEMALQKVIGDLGENPSPRQILDAITGAKTYNPAAKQNLFKNYLGAAEFEEIQRRAKASEIGKEQEKQEKREEFEERKRASSVAEKQTDRALDIQENKANKVQKEIHSEQQLNAGLQTVKEMRDIGKKNNLGIGTGIRQVFSSEAAKDAAQYEQLGKSLIPLASTITIRNRQEFETLAHKLFDPSIRDSARSGILDAMENIILRELGNKGERIAEETGQSKKIPEGKIRVRDKKTGKTGTVTPFEGMDAKYDRI
jgi:hypothetical protein